MVASRSQTKLSPPTSVTIASKLQTAIVWVFSILLLVVPFFFIWVNEELFEFNKMLLTYALTTIITGLWASRMILEERWLIKKTPFDIPLLLFLTSQIISTLLSIHPRTSFLGYYTRFHGGLLSTVTYIALYYAFVNNVEKRHLKNIIMTALIAGIGVSLYAIPEHFGASPSCLLINGQWDVSCWVQDVQNRVFGTFGQPNWLAAYAITLLPLGIVFSGVSLAAHQPPLKRLTPARFIVGLTAVTTLFATLLFTKSRSGILGLGVGLLSLVGLFTLNIANVKRLMKKSKYIYLSIFITLISSQLVLYFGTPFSPSISQLIAQTSTSVSSETGAQPIANRLENGGTESGEIRKIVWEGALKIWQRYPMFGSGVETFAYSYYQDRPAAHNLVSEWDFLYNKAHNEFLNFLATTGMVGFATYCLLIGWFGVWTVKQILSKNNQITTSDKAFLAALTSGLLALSVSNFFGFSTVMVSILLFMYLAWAAKIHDQNSAFVLPFKLPALFQWFKTAHGKKLSLGLVLVAAVWGLGTIGNWWLADYDYTQGKSLLSAGQTSSGLDHLQTASRRMPHEALFFDELSITYAQLAAVYNQEEDKSFVPGLVKAAILSSDKTLELNNRHLNFYKNRARVFIVLSEVDLSYLTQAEQALADAIIRAPTDAKLLYNLALVQAAAGKTPAAIENLEKTVTLKSNYEAAYLELGNQMVGTGNFTGAQQQYQYVLTNISSDNPTALEQLKVIAASVGAQLLKKK